MTGPNGFENIEVAAEIFVFEGGVLEFRPNNSRGSPDLVAGKKRWLGSSYL